jgi:hypothetical protein
MNPRVLEELAARHMADIRDEAASTRAHVGRGRSRARQQTLRVRTGWTLVDLGLKLAAGPQPHQRIPRPRPAGS